MGKDGSSSVLGLIREGTDLAWGGDPEDCHVGGEGGLGWGHIFLPRHQEQHPGAAPREATRRVGGERPNSISTYRSTLCIPRVLCFHAMLGCLGSLGRSSDRQAKPIYVEQLRPSLYTTRVSQAPSIN